MRAIVGGSGRLPDLLADASAPGTRLFAPAGIPFGADGRRAETFRPERLGELIEGLRAGGVGEIVFAGAMRRPRLDPSALDAFTAAAMPRLGPAFQDGDDRLLRTIVALFEEAGFRIVPAHEAAPSLLPPVGVLTRAQPTVRDQDDAARGFEILRVTAAADIGQACVVAQGQALALEATPGTDWMLAGLAGEVPGRPDPAEGAGVLCKAPKLGQDRRVDLPAIGPETMSAAVRAGLAGVAVEAGGVLVLELAAVLAEADRAGAFLWIRAP